jgi:hypothetical protein
MSVGPVRAVILIAVLLLGMAIGSAATWAFGPIVPGKLKVLEGYTTVVNQDGSAFGLAETPGDEAEYLGAYRISGVWWRSGVRPWHDTFPTCLEPMTSGQRVRMGVVEARPTGAAPGGPVVAWLECLE